MKKNLYPAFSVLLVDDELPWLRSLTMALNGEGGINNIIQCQDSRQVLDIINEQNVGLVLLDLTMPHVSGEQLLTTISETFPSVFVIVITGMNQVDYAVRCMKVGAFDYYVKTNDVNRIITGILHAIRIIELQRESRDVRSRLLTDRLENPEAFSDIVTTSKKMFAIFQYIESIALSKQPVLITGESGVGKELIARALYKACAYDKPMVSVNIAGLDDAMFSDTLFGHKRGAFTGADDSRSGLVEQAEETILFLDEIGDLSQSSQVKLLRLLQDGEYYSVGGDQLKRTKSRFVLATNHDLLSKQQCGEFRKDLFYRLQTHHIHIPPLRERKEDIPLLLEHFVKAAAHELGLKCPPNIPKPIPALLSRYAFPGNIRELRSIVYDEVCRNKIMLSADGFKDVINYRQEIESNPDACILGDAAILQVFLNAQRLPTYSEVEDILTEAALDKAGGNQTLAARMLGISQPGLSKRISSCKNRINK
ncbi:sigma-54-dependent Fis family transcriptional regulator [Oryzomonas sagensis]|uniref:Sigma-54-dependent Fis family transcriptional regulator n=1 Tax=Oryzomonas sagensis TaxID=2603857 RepID=A0ABQ6TKV3_9BACT|nr:sigma-54 dependent transcriptional regulator [Oryzomonas sagensis]KAB0668841.1 sigma-54-dependent Fis family transcriptional regulator [Oryzomonas sagensis]